MRTVASLKVRFGDRDVAVRPHPDTTRYRPFWFARCARLFKQSSGAAWNFSP